MGQRISLETDDINKVKYIEMVIMVLTLLLSLVTNVMEKSIFSLSCIIELIILVMLFRSQFKSIEGRNFSYWGINFLIFLFLLRIILHYTLVDYNVMVLYISFLVLTALGINSYILSSPIFYPRVQWWEYDFRYRGDLKAEVEIDGKQYKSRLIDLRREACCVELFERVKMDSLITISLSYEGKIYILQGSVKTGHEHIPGRQIRYGVKINTLDPIMKQDYLELQNLWQTRRKVKLRSKFKEIENVKKI